MEQKVWIRDALKRLQHHPLIASIKSGRYFDIAYFKVIFNDGIVEWWYLGEGIDPKHQYCYTVPYGPVFNNQTILTYREFETNPLEPNYEELLPYFRISTKELKQANFGSARLKIHEIIKELVDEGWVDFKYPDQSLRIDFQKVCKVKTKNSWEAFHRLRLYNALYTGNLLLSHFNSIGSMRYKNRLSYREAWDSISLFHVINYLIRTNKDITRSTVVKALGSQVAYPNTIAGPRIPDCTIWKAILEAFGFDSVYDLDYNFGEKMVAAAAIGVKYSGKNINQDLAKFIGTQSDKPSVTILGTLNTLSDEEFQNRLSQVKTPYVLAVITKEQLSKISVIKRFEIRTEFITLKNQIDIIAYFKTQNYNK